MSLRVAAIQLVPRLGEAFRLRTTDAVATPGAPVDTDVSRAASSR